jgi:uncharacterized delta-60 repeat protein
VLAAESDGEIILAGSASGSFSLLRYSADGQSLESTYAGAANVVPEALAVQPGGRIIALDSVLGETTSWSLTAFTQSGVPDSGFNGAGGIAISLLPPGEGHGEGMQLAVQPDGKVVVAGTSGTDAYFARYTSGGLDVPVARPPAA